MSNPDPCHETRIGGPRGPKLPGPGRTPTKWLRELLSAAKDKGPDGDSRRKAIGLHLVEVATSWKVEIRGQDYEVASARDSVAAAELLFRYDMGVAAKDTSALEIAEHFRKVERDRIDIAINALGDRLHTMDPKELSAFLRECATDPRGFLVAAEQFTSSGKSESEALAERDEAAQIEAMK